MANPVTVTIDKTALIQQAVGFLTANKVYVGIASDAPVREEDEGGPINNAQLGYILETGSPARNIPPRPHLVPGVEAVQDGVANYLKQGGKLALDGNLAGTEKALMAAGFTATNSVKTKINDNTPPPLAPATLAARRRRGRTGTNTLVDTGQYRNAMNYFIDDGQHRTLGDS